MLKINMFYFYIHSGVEYSFFFFFPLSITKLQSSFCRHKIQTPNSLGQENYHFYSMEHCVINMCCLKIPSIQGYFAQGDLKHKLIIIVMSWVNDCCPLVWTFFPFKVQQQQQSQFHVNHSICIFPFFLSDLSVHTDTLLHSFCSFYCICPKGMLICHIFSSNGLMAFCWRMWPWHYFQCLCNWHWKICTLITQTFISVVYETRIFNSWKCVGS